MEMVPSVNTERPAYGLSPIEETNPVLVQDETGKLRMWEVARDELEVPHSRSSAISDSDQASSTAPAAPGRHSSPCCV